MEQVTFAEQLKSARERLGLTQREVADLFQRSKSWVEKCEQGQEPDYLTRVGALTVLEQAKGGRPKKPKSQTDE